MATNLLHLLVNLKQAFNHHLANSHHLDNNKLPLGNNKPPLDNNQHPLVSPQPPLVNNLALLVNQLLANSLCLTDLDIRSHCNHSPLVLDSAMHHCSHNRLAEELTYKLLLQTIHLGFKSYLKKLQLDKRLNTYLQP